MKYLLDTTVLSETQRPKPADSVLRWLSERDETTLFISVLTLGELHCGIARLAEGKRRDDLQNWVDRELASRFYGRVLPVDEEVAAEWGRLNGMARQRGEPLPAVDSLIAATALVHHLTVVTRNARDIGRCGVPLLDPWT